MMNSEEFYRILKDKFPDAVGELVSGIPAEDFLIVDPLQVDKICLFLRDTENLEFDNLMNLSGVDDANGEKKTDDSGATVISGGTLSVFYHLESMKLKHKLTLKASTPRDNPEIVSVTEIWKSAEWHEREAYDMFGIRFINHPDLRRILMPYDWEAGYPLRKDYKNPEFYQGMKVPY